MTIYTEPFKRQRQTNGTFSQVWGKFHAAPLRNKSKFPTKVTPPTPPRSNSSSPATSSPPKSPPPLENALVNPGSLGSSRNSSPRSAGYGGGFGSPVRTPVQRSPASPAVGASPKSPSPLAPKNLSKLFAAVAAKKVPGSTARTRSGKGYSVVKSPSPSKLRSGRVRK